MTLDSARQFFEREQVKLFRDAARIERPGTGGTLNPDGTWTPGATMIIYDGPCLLRAFTWEGTTVTAGSLEARIRRLRAKFPKDAPLEREDIVIPTASTYDPSLIGLSFHVSDVFRDGWQITRVAILEEAT